MYVWQATNLTLKRNHFYRCAIMDVFITGSAVANGGYIENNVFEKPSPGSLAFHFRNGPTDPSPDPNNWDFRYNTFVGPLSLASENPVGPGGVASSATSSSPTHPRADTRTRCGATTPSRAARAAPVRSLAHCRHFSPASSAPRTTC